MLGPIELTDKTKPSLPDTIIFDLDGTLVDTLPLIYRSFNAALYPVLGRELSDSEIRATFGPPDNQIISEFVDEPVERDAAIDRYVSVYRQDHQEYARVFEGIPEFLEDAASLGVRLAVVTGKSRITAVESLEQTGLAHFFGVVIAGDDVEKQKPDPEAISLALQQLGHEPGRPGAMIGDSEADVQAGKRCGLMTIGVLWGVPEHDNLMRAGPDHVAGTVDDVRTLLAIHQGETSLAIDA